MLLYGLAVTPKPAPVPPPSKGTSPPFMPPTTQQPTPGTTVTVTPGWFAPGWYKTPFGITLLAIAGFIGYRLYAKKKG